MTKLTKAPPSPTLADAMQVIWHKTPMRMYGVSDSQLEELTAGYNSLYLILFGICVGAAISLGIAWREATSVADKPYYCGSFIATLLVALLSGLAGFTNYWRAFRRKQKLYEDSVPLTPL
jgi:glucan phosphoethanolaminetransferase (alkaline phosphatase superfamily)